MHKFVVVLTPQPDRLISISDRRCECGDWDYAVVGGRYANLIPVGHGVKGTPSREEGIVAENGFPWGNILNNQNFKYITTARIRNINRQECERIANAGGLTIFNPASFIIDSPGFDDCEYDFEYDTQHIYFNFLNRPDRQHYYACILDVHY